MPGSSGKFGLSIVATVTYAGLADELEREPELLRRLGGELGFPPPEDDRLRDEDAEMLKQVVTTLDLADDDELSRFARLYGGTIQRLVGSGLQFFDLAVRQKVAEYDLANEEKDALVYRRAGAYTELVQGVVSWLQRRHREHAVLEYIVGVTEQFMEERGDEAAAALASDLAGVVHEAALTQGCRPVKWLGDGVMFHFSDASVAIRSGLELIEKTEKAVKVPARIGIDAGSVVVQDGDYFGRTVNVASRIADYARPHEVLVSDAARETAGLDGVEFELIGDVPLKGVSKAVRLHKAVRA